MKMSKEDFENYMREKSIKACAAKSRLKKQNDELIALYKKTKVVKKRTQWEKKDHVMFMDMLKLKFRSIVKFVYKIEHAGEKTITEGKKLKEAGLQDGVFDYFITIPINSYHGLWLEFKHGKKKLSNAQQVFKELQEFQNYKCDVAYSPEEGIEKIEMYLNV